MSVSTNMSNVSNVIKPGNFMPTKLNDFIVPANNPLKYSSPSYIATLDKFALINPDIN